MYEEMESPYRIPGRSPEKPPPAIGEVPPAMMVFMVLILAAVIWFLREPAADVNAGVGVGGFVHSAAHIGHGRH
jgi:hypothetical protein